MEVNISDLVREVAEDEAIMAAASIPTITMGFVGCILVFAAIAKSAITKKDELWKPRNIFEAFSLVNSVIGMFLGVYGCLFTIPRSGFVDARSWNLDQNLMLHLFLFHRYLLLGGDLFTSLDRCLAVLYPLKYYMLATAQVAIGILAMWTSLSIGFTLASWSIGVVPSYLADAPMNPLFLLPTRSFVHALGIPYLVILASVFVFDMTALVIALMRRRQMTSPTASSNFNGLSSSTSEDRAVIVTFKSRVSIRKSTDDSIALGYNGYSKERKADLAEVQLTIRCLSITTWYFVSQLCTFIPGIILYGCEGNEPTTESLENGCKSILAIEMRIFIFFFYQFQFLKPYFFMVFDSELGKGVGKLFGYRKHEI